MDRPAGSILATGTNADERAAKLAALQALVTEGLESGISQRSKDDIRRLSREIAAAPRV